MSKYRPQSTPASRGGNRWNYLSTNYMTLNFDHVLQYFMSGFQNEIIMRLKFPGRLIIHELVRNKLPADVFTWLRSAKMSIFIPCFISPTLDTI